MLHEIKGNLLEFPADVICHQTNCFTNHASGLAKDLFEKFPAANTYKYRSRGEPELFGTNSYHKIGDLTVCNMYAQIYPGKWSGIGGCGRYMDTAALRKNAFQACLNDLALYCLKNSLTKIAFPFKISCGQAQGSWKDYKKLLEDFAAENPQFKVFVINPFL